MMSALLAPDEVDLVGAWVPQDGRVVGDAVEQRIHLIVARLEEVARDQSGWEILYRDPVDGRYWELTYPQSEMHGGGPKRLACVMPSAAAAKYRLD